MCTSEACIEGWSATSSASARRHPRSYPDSSESAAAGEDHHQTAQALGQGIQQTDRATSHWPAARPRRDECAPPERVRRSPGPRVRRASIDSSGRPSTSAKAARGLKSTIRRGDHPVQQGQGITHRAVGQPGHFQRDFGIVERDALARPGCSSEVRRDRGCRESF